MPKKVLHLRCSGGFLGAESVVIELARHALDFGYEPVICVPYDLGDALPELVTVATGHGIKTLALPCRHRLDLATLQHLRRIVVDEAIDVVHTHGYREDIYAALSLFGRPLVATNHLWKRSNRWLRIYARLDVLALKRFDRVVAVSDPILDEMKRLGLPPHKLHKIANGVDARRFAGQPPSQRDRLRGHLGFPANATILGMVSSLTAVKGHRFALEAMAGIANTFPQAHLLIVGDGPEESVLRKQCASLQLGERVRFCGRRADVPAVLSALDMFLLPSLAEGLPMALLEAMAAGLPVIASRVGDVGAVVEQGKSGFTVPAGDVAALVGAIKRLLAEPPLAHAMGSNAMRRVRDTFSSAAMTGAYCALYDESLRGFAHEGVRHRTASRSVARKASTRNPMK